jgi:hypothetical protein
MFIVPYEDRLIYFFILLFFNHCQWYGYGLRDEADKIPHLQEGVPANSS